MTRNLFLTRLQDEVLVYASIAGVLEWGGWLKAGVPCESYNLENADLIFGLYRDYIKAGVDLIVTNTQAANRTQLLHFGLENQLREINLRGIEIARKAAGGRALVAGAIGPTGKYINPVVTYSFEKVVDVYREQIVALKEGRPDLLIITNISQIREMKAALIACRELYRGPVISEMVFKTITEETSALRVESMLTILAPFQPDVVGVACSKFSELLHLLEKMAGFSQMRLSVALENLPTGIAPFTPEEMGYYATQLAEMGASIIGGGNAATPEHIREIALRLNHRKPAQRSKVQTGSLASQNRMLQIGPEFPTVWVGNRLNSATNPKMRKSLKAGRQTDILTEAHQQIRSGASILELFVAAPKVDEVNAMAKYVTELEKLDSPVLCLYSEKSEVLEAGLQNLAGKALVGLAADDEQYLSQVLPFVKKYGAAIIISPVQTEDRDVSTENQLVVLERRLAICRDYGIKVEDVWVNCSLRKAQSDENDFFQIIKIIREIKTRLALKTIFSFHQNSMSKAFKTTFLTMALANGLDLPVIDPFDSSVLKTISAVDLILGRGRIDT